MKKKEYIAKAVQAIRNIVFIIGFLFIFNYISNVFEAKLSRYKYEPFYAQKEDFDVLFFGTSHVRNEVYPMELWHEQGIVSYNFGGHATAIPTMYWYLMNSLEYTNPKLVVVDVSSVERDAHVYNIESVHKEFDHMPLSKTKIDAMNDLFSKDTTSRNGEDEYKRKWELIWNFQLYHSRWTELTKEDFELENVTLEKGASIMKNVAEPKSFKLIEKSDYDEFDSIGLKYLKKIIDECKERDIDILLIYLPGTIKQDIQRKYNYIYKFAEEQGVNYVNLMYEDLVDFNTDSHDSSNENNHLNISGGRKVTTWLGEYIKDNYDVPDRRDDEDYKQWHDDYELYVNDKVVEIKNEKNIESFLALIAYKGYDSLVRVRAGADVSIKCENLLKNLSQYKELELIDSAIENKEEYFFIVDNGNKEVWESRNFENIDKIETSFGMVSYGQVTDKGCYLNVSDDVNLFDYWTDADEEHSGEPMIQIAVIDGRTGEIVAVKNWY